MIVGPLTGYQKLNGHMYIIVHVQVLYRIAMIWQEPDFQYWAYRTAFKCYIFN